MIQLDCLKIFAQALNHSLSDSEPVGGKRQPTDGEATLKGVRLNHELGLWAVKQKKRARRA